MFPWHSAYFNYRTNLTFLGHYVTNNFCSIYRLPSICTCWSAVDYYRKIILFTCGKGEIEMQQKLGYELGEHFCHLDCDIV
jgi:hypothetical protein